MNSKTRTAWTFLAPMLLVLALVAVWPLGRTIWFSFTDANINDIDAAKFVGLENYFGKYGLFANPNHTDGFWNSDWGLSILNTLKFSLVSVTLETALGLAVALLLNQEFKGRAWVRAAVLVVGDGPGRQELEELMALARARGRHLVLSGRNAPDWLVEAADLVTSMTEIKHPWRTGVKAAPGIEF